MLLSVLQPHYYNLHSFWANLQCWATPTAHPWISNMPWTMSFQQWWILDLAMLIHNYSHSLAACIYCHMVVDAQGSGHFKTTTSSASVQHSVHSPFHNPESSFYNHPWPSSESVERPMKSRGSVKREQVQLIYLPFATGTAQCCNHNYII